MKITIDKLKKIVVDVVKNYQDKKELALGVIKVEAVENKFYSGRGTIYADKKYFTVQVVQLKELTHPTDPKRFDMAFVGDYDAVWYYKGTKKKVSKKDFDKWLKEHQYVDVKFNPKYPHFTVNEYFTVGVGGADNAAKVFKESYGRDLMTDDSEFYSASLDAAFNKAFNDAGLCVEPYSENTFNVGVA